MEKNLKQKQREQIQFQDWVARMFPEAVGKDNLNNEGKLKREGLSKTITFQVTDACNLACSYCYQINKGTRRMSWEVAKTLVDKLLSGKDGFKEYIGNSPAIILEFIGGEPFLEIDLIDRIVDYFREQAIIKNHPWAEKFNISICSNGILYSDERVQRFLQKNRNNIGFSVTVDGTKKLHDSCRLFPNGDPSYDIAHNAALDWMAKGNYMGSKITMAPSNIKYFSDCLKQMIADGYYDINCNPVYEKGWTIEDARIIYQQCKNFADWMNENNMNNYEYAISFLDCVFSHSMDPEKENENWCGGLSSMLACDPDGDLYSCLRFMESSLGNNQKPLKIGNIWDGIAKKQCEKDCLECMHKVTRRSQSTDECFYCPIANGCSWCSAYNYQETGSVDKRVTYICDIQKARSLAIVYYWNTFFKRIGEKDAIHMWCPREWAEPIIGKEEYDALANLTKSLGGEVNYDRKEIRD